MAELKFQEAWVQVTGLLVLFLAIAAVEEQVIGDNVIAGVLLSQPINMSYVETSIVNFTYYPVTNGTIHHAELWIYDYDLGSWAYAATNTTNVTNGTLNVIQYDLLP